MIEKRLLKKINFIEIYQIIGGVIGIAFTVYLVMTTNLHKYQNIFGYITIISPFVFFGFCIYSGVLLNQKKFVFGLKLVVISLLFQVIAFEMFGLFYSAINGIGVKVTLEMTNDTIVGFDFHPSHFLFQTTKNLQSFILKVNLVALAMLFYTLKVNKEIETQTDKN